MNRSKATTEFRSPAQSIALRSHTPSLKRSQGPPQQENLSPRSRSIPIANSLKRTASELQLSEEEAMADFRDYVLFSRIVDGISKQAPPKDFRLRQANDRCLAHIIHERNSAAQANVNKEWGLATNHRKYHMETPSLEYLMGRSMQDEDAMFALDL
jgi:hypothetical protein